MTSKDEIVFFSPPPFLSFFSPPLSPRRQWGEKQGNFFPPFSFPFSLQDDTVQLHRSVSLPSGNVVGN